METDRIKFTEHLAADCPLSLKEFCSSVQKELALPDFEFDYENETEWGTVEHKNIEYNISRPYECGTLHKWDNSVPLNCNFRISLIIPKDSSPKYDLNWGLIELVPQIGQTLSNLFKTEIYHHRTWIGVGQNLIRNQVFRPKSV
jgi:hypothetical protein